jgi:hypothetical protein
MLSLQDGDRAGHDYSPRLLTPYCRGVHILDDVQFWTAIEMSSSVILCYCLHHKILRKVPRFIRLHWLYTELWWILRMWKRVFMSQCSLRMCMAQTVNFELGVVTSGCHMLWLGGWASQRYDVDSWSSIILCSLSLNASHPIHRSPYIVWVDYWCGCWLRSTWVSSYKWLLVCKHIGIAWELDVTFN